MSYAAPASLVAEYQRVREMLLASFPELADDAQALADTLEGETGLHDALAAMIRKSQDAEAYEEALGHLIAEKAARKERWGRQSIALRNTVLELMQAAGISKLVQPDFTASVGKGRGKVVIADEAELPDAFFRVSRSPDKTAIGRALNDNKTVPGALLSNAEPTLTVRTK